MRLAFELVDAAETSPVWMGIMQHVEGLTEPKWGRRNLPILFFVSPTELGHQVYTISPQTPAELNR